MNSRQNPIRAFGQRSIASSLIPRSSNSFNNSKEDVTQREASKKDSKESLSDFLDRKLRRNAELPKTLQGKASPFSLVSPLKLGGSNEGEGKKRCLVDKGVFEQFKHTTSTEEVDCVASSSCDVGETVVYSGLNDRQESRHQRNPFEGIYEKNSVRKQVIGLGDHPSLNDMPVSRKRRNPFEGVDEKHISPKHMLVLGNDSKPKQSRKQSRFISRKKPRPLYNHYENGSGWWDSDMEGVDSEEVGFGEVWEGVGSTTFGGLEWH